LGNGNQIAVMTRVIVTGASGFLGAHIVQSYLESNSTVLAVGHRNEPAIGRDEPMPRLKQVKLDICGPTEDFDIFAGYDLVIHSAARIYAKTSEERVYQERVNIDGTRNIIQACLRNGVSRLIYISTTAAIGISQDPNRPADETFRFNLEHLKLGYNSTKHRAEQLVLEANCPLLETVVVSPGFIFGRDGDTYRGAQIIETALRKRLVICTNGGLSIVHIDDVIDGIRRAATDGRAGERYILSGENIAFADISRTVASKTKKPAKVLAVPNLIRDFFGVLFTWLAPIRQSNRPLHLARRYAYQYYSSEKARREFGYNPRSFEEIVMDYMRNIRR